jgi:hypothetical protein
VVAQVYRRYQARLLEQNAMDFDDLLMRMVDILRLFPRGLTTTAGSFATSSWTNTKTPTGLSIFW